MEATAKTKTWIVALALLLPGLALALEPAAVIRGSWIAKAGPSQVLRGGWSAQVTPESANAAVGSWTVVDPGDRIVLEGTWAAQKLARGWRGTWSARVQNGGAPLSGTWEADGTGLRGQTFEDLLKQTAQRQIAGSWRRGRARGQWWLEGPR